MFQCCVRAAIHYRTVVHASSIHAKLLKRIQCLSLLFRPLIRSIVVFLIVIDSVRVHNELGADQRNFNVKMRPDVIASNVQV